MIICPTLFEDPDPHSPDYSLEEVDFYAWIPYPEKHGGDHRLSLRKNLLTQDFEIYKAYCRTLSAPERSEVVFRSNDLRAALDFAASQYRRYHNHDWNDEICDHGKTKRAAIGCKVVRRS